MEPRASRRVARTEAAVRAERATIAAWLAGRRADPRFRRFTAHFEVLDTVLARMLDAVAAAAGSLPGQPSGRTYERCRELDRGLATVRRTFEWYATKYDQRLDDRRAPILLAADEVVRSCWSEPFAALGRQPPTGPLPYLDARFDAFATPRVSVPPDLRAPADSRVAEHVRELPIPTIALPESATREAWWLVLAAHETGHHVQLDALPGLAAATRAELTEATGDLGGYWSQWAHEVFADAYSVLMVGPAAAWAVDELQHATPARLATAPQPGDRYPPRAVRLALLGELARCAQVGTVPGADAMITWVRALDSVPAAVRQTVERHLAVTPSAAAALVDLPIDGHSLRELSGLRPEWFAATGRVARWRKELATPEPMVAPIDARPAARLLIAAGVQAADEGEAAAQTHDNLLALLPSCGPPGVLAPAAPAEPAAVADLADRLATRLVKDPPEDPPEDPP